MKAAIIFIVIGVSFLVVKDFLGFKIKRGKFRKNIDNEEQERRFDFLNVLLSSIKTHDQLINLLKTMENYLTGNDYFDPKYDKLMERIREKETALRRLRVKEGTQILKTVNFN